MPTIGLIAISVQSFRATVIRDFNCRLNKWVVGLSLQFPLSCENLKGAEPLFVKLVFENDVVVSILGHYQLTLMMWNSLQTTVESLKV